MEERRQQATSSRVFARMTGHNPNILARIHCVFFQSFNPLDEWDQREGMVSDASGKQPR